ncbi:MAG: hypothetical protein JRI52_11105, partial [Deltaproteobacteria bacterium]|nr:hypothetical protein [Deltaproteobacteria bacterium]
VEYGSLLSYSVFRRCAIVVSGGFCKVTIPVTTTVCWPFGAIKGKVRGLLRSKEHDERITSLEKRLSVLDKKKIGDLAVKIMEIDKRMSTIEKHDVVLGSDAVIQKKGKKLSKDRLSMLSQIVDANLSLREDEDE